MPHLILESEDLALKFIDIPFTPWYSPAGLNRGRGYRTGPILNLGDNLELHTAIRLWCREFLSGPAKPIWNVSKQRYEIIFQSEDDIVAFKLRWW